MSNFTDFFPAAVGVDLQSSVKTANFTAVANEGYLVNTTSSVIIVTLPSSPSLGDEVLIIDYAGTFGTNNLTLTSSDNILGSSDNYAIRSNDVSVILIYTDATKGWKVKTGANEGTSALVEPLIDADFLVVAGGGAGSDTGGGGAGGLRTSYGTTTGGGGSSESSLNLSVTTNYTVSIGSGGIGGLDNATTVRGTNGSDSVFATITSTGGGAGGNSGADVPEGNGVNGGSGGGGATRQGSNNQKFGGSAITSPVIQGYGGGDGTTNYWTGGGGGGAAATGGSATGGSNPGVSGAGGSGLAVNILNTTNATTESVGEVSGSDVYYSGGGSGGNGGAGSSNGGAGIGGGGFGENSLANPGVIGNGSTNTGGGGGGSWNMTAGNGGSGVVILRYPDVYTITETTSPNVLTFNTYTEGSDKVTVFTAGENGTIQFS